MLLRGKQRRLQFSFSAFSVTVGLWFLTQSFYGFFEAAIWQRFTAILAVLLPQFALQLFEGMVPQAPGARSPLIRFGWISAIPMLVLQATPLHATSAARFLVFLYVFSLITLGLYELGQRGAKSTSRATQRRVRFLVVIGAMAGLATILDFLWFLGARTPPIGAVFVVLFLFALSQSLRYERILDLYEMVGRLLVAVAVAFLIAGIFYVLLTFLGGFNTMYLNAVLAATVLLVLFEPLQARVEEQIQRLFFRERFDLEHGIADLRRKLGHTLELSELGSSVIAALEQSRRVTSAALYLRENDGAGFDKLASLGPGIPNRIDVATARAVLERLELGSLSLEDVEREVRDRRARGEASAGPEATLAASEVLGSLRVGVWVAVRDEQGEMVGLIAVADDRVHDAFSQEEVALLEHLATQVGVVIENSRVYDQMKEKDRLAVLGQMAAGLAHEIRNPLGAIKGAAQLLAEPMGPSHREDPSSREFIGIILEEVERLNRVVGNVLDLARPSENSVVPIDVNAVVRRTLQVLGAERTSGVDLTTTLEDELPRVSVDPEQLRQVLMNLMRNAVQAAGDRGRVNVTTRVRFGRSTRSGAGPKDGGTFVEINVADTGPGMSQKTLEKIFLPFFTTKDRGTGLGLAISQRIVQGAGGRIEVRSYEGKGSTFTVVLPAVMDALGTPTPSPTKTEGAAPAP